MWVERESRKWSEVMITVSGGELLFAESPSQMIACARKYPFSEKWYFLARAII